MIEGHEIVLPSATLELSDQQHPQCPIRVRSSNSPQCEVAVLDLAERGILAALSCRSIAPRILQVQRPKAVVGSDCSNSKPQKAGECHSRLRVCHLALAISSTNTHAE